MKTLHWIIYCFAFGFTQLLFAQNAQQTEDSVRQWTISTQNQEEDSLKIWLLIETEKQQSKKGFDFSDYETYYQRRTTEKRRYNSEGKDITPDEPDPNGFVFSFEEKSQVINLAEVTDSIKSEYYTLLSLLALPTPSYKITALICVEEYGRVYEYSILTEIPIFLTQILEKQIHSLVFSPQITQGKPFKCEHEIVFEL